jgi:CRISPR system Cascade subunit CasD
MPVLLMQLAGPMQSWGTRSRFSIRDTEREPSKSGVVGLLCAALGVDRDDDCGLRPLAAMRMGVRVDRDGVLAKDFHTAGGGSVPGVKTYGVAKAGGGTPDTVTSTRYYLADAEFIVALESSDRELLATCDAAAVCPIRPINCTARCR